MNISEFKVRIMLKHGFERESVSVRQVIIYCYKGYEVDIGRYKKDIISFITELY